MFQNIRKLRLLSLSFFSAFLIYFWSAAAFAIVIDFEDAFSSVGHQGDPATFYQSQGLTIAGNYFGILEGVSRGDSGNFDLEGTSGPASFAVNMFGQSIDLVFSSPLTSVCLDIGTAFFAQEPGSPEITIVTYLGGMQQSSNLVTVVDTLQNGEGTWHTQQFSQIDRITLTATSGYRVWAIDNIVVNEPCETNNDEGTFFVIPTANGNVVVIEL